jgi:hypothetical protein
MHFCKFVFIFGKVFGEEFHLSSALVKRTNIDKSVPDYCVMGTVIQEVKTSNIAREVFKSIFKKLSIISYVIGFA